MRARGHVKRVAFVCVSAIYLALMRLADLLRRLAGGAQRRRRVTLYYHGIPAAGRSEFAWQMDELAACATPVGGEPGAVPREGRLLAAVTFDDGFRSFAENALPELTKRRIPSALFVPAGNLGRPPEWLAGSGHPDARETVLDADELRRLPADTVTVGSHTLTHPRLTELAEGDARRELVESREVLERLLGRRVTLLSLPHGDFDAKVLDLAREAEYSRVFTVSPSLAEPGDGAFLAGRCPASPGDWRIEFRLKVRGGYGWLPAASAVRRGLSRVWRRRAS